MSTTKPTPEQVTAEIEALKAIKPRVRRRSFFGNDNHAAIDAQIAALTDRMSVDQVYGAYGDGDDDAAEGDELNAALQAVDWLNGIAYQDAPSKGWQTAVVS